MTLCDDLMRFDRSVQTDARDAGGPTGNAGRAFDGIASDASA